MATIHLRCRTDSRGDTTDYAWYCSRTCYLHSLEWYPPSVEFEEGGAYPCGAESDSPDHCAGCGTPVGNSLTDEGLDYVRSILEDPNRFGPLARELSRAYTL